MGTSAFPRTEAQVARIERLMARPLPAAEAGAALSGVLEDDTLLDMIGAVARRAPERDVRGLVAMTLDELVNWSSPDGFRKGPRQRGRDWPDALRERCGILVWRQAGDDDALAFSRAGPFDDARAEALVAACLEGGTAVPGRLEVRPGTGPGSRVVIDGHRGGVYRVEGFYGLVSEAPEALRDAIVARTAPAVGRAP